MTLLSQHNPHPPPPHHKIFIQGRQQELPCIDSTCCLWLGNGHEVSFRLDILQVFTRVQPRHYKDENMHFWTIYWRIFLDRHQHSHLLCHCVLCSTHLTMVCRSQTPASPCGIVVFKPCQNEYTYTWFDRWAGWSECFSWLADMAEDPSQDGILKPHLQHICDPHW